MAQFVWWEWHLIGTRGGCLLWQSGKLTAGEMKRLRRATMRAAMYGGEVQLCLRRYTEFQGWESTATVTAGALPAHTDSGKKVPRNYLRVFNRIKKDVTQ